MKRTLAAVCLFLPLLASTAWGLDLRQGFGDFRWGQTCHPAVAGPGWVVERAKPVWDAQVQLFELQYEPVDQSTGQFVLHYNKDATPTFDGVPLGRTFYGCDRTNDRFSLVVLSHDLLAVPKLIEKTTALLGPPTNTTMIQTIWVLPDLYVQIDQVYMIIYDRRDGKIGKAAAVKK